MSISTIANTLNEFPKKNRDLWLGAGGSLTLGIMVLLFPSWITWALIFAALFGVVAVFFSYEYLPLLLFLLLAFSIEVPLVGETNITLPTEPFIPFITLLLGLGIVLRGKFTYRPSVMNVAVFFFWLATVASLLVTQEPLSTVKALIRDTGYLFAGFYLIPRYVTSERRLKHLLIACLVVHTVLVFYGFATQAINGIRIYDQIAAPFFIEHSIYAAFITLSFSFIFGYFLDRDDDFIRWLLGGVALIFFIAIGLTFVRAAWLSVILLCLFYLFQFRHKRSSIDLTIIMILSFLLVLAVLFFSDLGRLFTQRIETITDLEYVANYDRIDRWYAAWLIWQDYPWFGVGWGAYPDVYFDYNVFDNAYSSHLRMGAHNLYLEIMAEMGLLGFVVFLVLLYTFFYRTLILQKKAQSRLIRIFVISMQGAMLTYLFHAFLNNLGPSDKISICFWTMMGMVPTLEALVKQQQPQAALPAATAPSEPDS